MHRKVKLKSLTFELLMVVVWVRGVETPYPPSTPRMVRPSYDPEAKKLSRNKISSGNLTSIIYDSFITEMTDVN